ncbi:muscarinic acetylcholine receptor M5 [Gopherus flavomarginatus]|uniref:muscarinic acetylcholine receptor M5 n=1 Tax=Gopherus flavomarginatus TaxID=286002 RepID=UPI0021CC3E6F|nr:muscarinic acetylcholine receptor M5 [Gopherus flavomarginatus]XP_050810793.1 muscarinic acetylcholine receptor M5 [Gopherus flavomarginatus]
MEVNSTTVNSSSVNHKQLEGHSLLEVIAIATVTAIVSLITIVGNILVMISFKVNSQLKTVNNYYLLSLACADLIIGIFSMNLYTSYILIGHWSLGSLACDLWLALDYVASNASVMNLLVISFDRYFSITRPLTYRAKRTPKRAGIMIGLAWLISFILWAPPILCWQYFVGERTVPSKECQIQFLYEPIITFGTAIAAFYIPVSVMTILYCRIYKETEKRTKDLAELQGSESVTELEMIKPQKALLKSCFSCKQQNLAKRERCQASWSSSSRSTSATAKVPQTPNTCNDWSKADQLTTCSSYASSEEEDKSANDSVFEVTYKSPAKDKKEEFNEEENKEVFIKDHPMENDFETQKYFLSPAKSQAQKSPKCVAYKFHLVVKADGTQETNNGCRKVKITTCSAALSKDPSIKGMDPNLSNQITKRKRMVLIKERKAAQTLSAILLAFIITWTPYNIMVLVSTFCADCIPLTLWHLGYWLCYVNSTVNPICYALCNKTFRKTFKMLLFCQWKNKKVEEKLYWQGNTKLL